jgi:Fe-S-cluster-containing dehydrogenase component
MKPMIHIDLNRCIGCWTCSMACKMGNALADDEYRLTVRTLGNGRGIDRPAGIYPDLHMEWQPVYTKACTMCAGRTGEGKSELPYCVYDCPTGALAFGDADDAKSAYCAAVERCRDAGADIFALASYEDSKSGVTYASRR